MRKNKFAYPLTKKSQSSFEFHQKKSPQIDHPLVQNKIHFPKSHNEKLMSNQLQLTNEKMIARKIELDILFQIGERLPSKQKNSKRLGFGRQKKIGLVQDQNKNKNEIYLHRKDFVKYNTLQLKNMPGVNFTASGLTMYRRKNIKSVGKLLSRFTPDKIHRPGKSQRKSQIKRNLSVRNQESLESNIRKIKGNNFNKLNLNEKNILLYKSYFTSRHDLKGEGMRPLKASESKEVLAQNPQDVFCQKIIQAELYGSDNSQQQQFL